MNWRLPKFTKSLQLESTKSQFRGVGAISLILSILLTAQYFETPAKLLPSGTVPFIVWTYACALVAWYCLVQLRVTTNLQQPFDPKLQRQVERLSWVVVVFLILQPVGIVLLNIIVFAEDPRQWVMVAKSGQDRLALIMIVISGLSLRRWMVHSVGATLFLLQAAVVAVAWYSVQGSAGCPSFAGLMAAGLNLRQHLMGLLYIALLTWVVSRYCDLYADLATLMDSHSEDLAALRSKQLAETLERTQTLVTATPDSIIRLSPDGPGLRCEVARISPSLGRLLAPDHEGKRALNPQLQEACLELARGMSDLKPYLVAERGFIIGDLQLFVELHCSVAGQGEYICFIRDISDRKLHEQSLQTMIAQEQELSAARSQFLSFTSHELRNPLSIILGSTELLGRYSERMNLEKRTEITERVLSSGRRMTALLDKVLLFNRTGSGRLEVRYAPLDLRKLAGVLLSEVDLADQHQHRFVLEANGTLNEFSSDPNLLQHILTNLLSNAARYSHPGTTITLRLTITDLAAEFVVTDQGIGILAADLGRLFQPFVRGSNVGAIPGTGLGLSIVQRLVTLLSGTIHVDSTPGQGSVFTVRLPRPG
ncbi:MAG: HAMP domain-containing sensor histidine kinase [Opitutales bacterium]|nr:HAMP domain-containing sensor histidine kinase [Opitutales bacterium]